MNNVSKFKKGGIICVMLLLLGSSVSAELIYNPETGTYTDDSIITTDTDDVWIPVQDSDIQPEEIETSAPETTSEEDILLVQDPAPENTETQEEIIEFDEGDPIITISDTEATTLANQAGGLESMLSDATSVLGTYLDQQASDLAGVYNEHIATRYGASFGDLVACIGDQNAVSQIQREIQGIVDTLDTRVKTDSADIFAQIANLAYRNDIGLLAGDALAIESNVVATNIDAFNQNFISLIDHYVEQANSSITSFVDTQEAAEYETILQDYLARKSKLDQLKQAFTVFENGSFFSQTIVGPRADELEDLSEEIFTVFKNDMLSRWGNRSPQDFDNLVESMRSGFDAKVDDAIVSLFPHDNIQRLYNSYNVLSEVYGIDADAYNCQEVISNDAVDTAGPELIGNIEAVQQDIAIGYSATGGPTNWLDLQAGLTDFMQEYFRTTMQSQFESAYATAQTVVLSEAEQLFNTYRAQVITFLLNMRIEYTSNNNLSGFEQKMNRAITRIDAAIDDGAEGHLLLILDAIRSAVVAVLEE